MKTYSLYEINEFIRRTIALNFPRPIWIEAEIAQANRSRGHLYLQLIQKDEDSEEVLAKSDAVIWASTFVQLKRKLGRGLDGLLQEGIQVKVAARLEFSERYGFKLIIFDLDPIYTIGQVEKQRLENLARLEKKAYTRMNAEIPLPPVLQRIALITAKTAAGYQDFITTLQHNPYGYAFEVQLFPTAMQGKNAAPEIIQQINEIQKLATFDAIVITRGGGARLDLMAFDDYHLNVAVAKCKYPVLVGVGHQTDTTILDLIACRSLKTPTALAEFLISYQMDFESAILMLAKEIHALGLTQLSRDNAFLHELAHILRWNSKAQLEREAHLLGQIHKQVYHFA
ncbi:MAG TPA: exodeoxyribonuclease VII large subunit, partial [Phaeodactylibacter sp.]|nr:exodeoxyribonuclease VII large subunit [Phaeodactylibacter sp.]